MKAPKRGFWSRLKVYWALEMAARKLPHMRLGQLVDNSTYTPCAMPVELFVLENDTLVELVKRLVDRVEKNKKYLPQ